MCYIIFLVSLACACFAIGNATKPGLNNQNSAHSFIHLASTTGIDKNETHQFEPLFLEPRPVRLETLDLSDLPTAPDFPEVKVPEHLERRSGVPFEFQKWNDTILFVVDASISKSNYDLLHTAAREIRDVICLKMAMRYSNTTNPNYHPDTPYILEETNSFVPYVYIQTFDIGCYSTVGRRGINGQILNLGEGCFEKSIIMHEMIHALGFDHEHNRPDRAKYMSVNLPPINLTDRHNFDLVTNGLTFGLPYDFYSIMHYSERAFSNNGLKTLDARLAGIKAGSRGVLTSLDVQKLRLLYKCPENPCSKSGEPCIRHDQCCDGGLCHDFKTCKTGADIIECQTSEECPQCVFHGRKDCYAAVPVEAKTCKCSCRCENGVIE